MAENPVQRRLAAILAADVVGYSRLVGQDEDGTLATIRKLRAEVIEPKIAEHQGRLFKTMGDGFLVEFPSVVNAVACAVDIQKAMAARNTDLPEDRQTHLRIGVHLGDVVVESGDVYGDGVNIAARIESLASPGGLAVSAMVHDNIGNRLELAFEDMGEQQLKNIAKPLRVFHLAAASRLTIHAKQADASKPSIAILPFTNMSSDAEQEYFADGMVEDIITELSRFSDLLVIARNSSFSYKHQSVDVRKVSRELGARYILEGSIRRHKEDVRVTAQLLDGQLGNHLWAEKYDGSAEDVFSIQDEITRKVVGSIAPQIELAEMERTRKLSNSQITAYDLALRSRALVYDAIRQGSRQLLEQAIELASEALKLNSHNSHACMALALAYNYQCLYRWGENPDAALTNAERVIDRLMQLDPVNARSYMVRAWVRHFRRDNDAAYADYKRAFELNPNDAMNLYSMAWEESFMGLSSAAKEHAHLAFRLSPRDTDVWLGEGYLALTQATFAEQSFDEALHWGKLAIQFGPKVPIRRLLMISAEGHLGKMENARQHFDALSQFAPQFISDVLSGAIEVYLRPEHRNLVVEGLRKTALMQMK